MGAEALKVVFASEGERGGAGVAFIHVNSNGSGGGGFVTGLEAKLGGGKSEGEGAGEEGAKKEGGERGGGGGGRGRRGGGWAWLAVLGFG